MDDETLERGLVWIRRRVAWFAFASIGITMAAYAIELPMELLKKVWLSAAFGVLVMPDRGQ